MKQRGFTLIEVMIVVAIFALIVLVAAPLSGGWIRESDLVTAEAQLTEAIGRAKAAALRNGRAATDENPVAAVCRSDSNLLTVIEGTAAAAPSCAPTGNQIWQAQLSSHVTVEVDSSNLSCLCFSNKGQLTTAGACGSCSTSTNFTLNAGSHTTNVAVY
jgi:prepilin-type N-terminal cleavage/methylation domain-containing protein